MHGDETWALLCCYCAKLLQADVSHGTDRNEELKRRIRQWERAEMDDLVLRIVGQQIVSSFRQPRPTRQDDQAAESEEKRGEHAC